MKQFNYWALLVAFFFTQAILTRLAMHTASWDKRGPFVLTIVLLAGGWYLFERYRNAQPLAYKFMLILIGVALLLR